MKDCFKEGTVRGQCYAARTPVTTYKLELAGPKPRAVHVITATDAKTAIASTALSGNDYAGVNLTGMRDASGRFHKQLNAVLLSNLPLDPRRSLYVAWGDWFAALCGAVCAALAVWSTVQRFGGKNTTAV